jgi:hypothetical protein
MIIDQGQRGVLFAIQSFEEFLYMRTGSPNIRLLKRKAGAK